MEGLRVFLCKGVAGCTRLSSKSLRALLGSFRIAAMATSRGVYGLIFGLKVADLRLPQWWLAYFSMVL